MYTYARLRTFHGNGYVYLNSLSPNLWEEGGGVVWFLLRVSTGHVHCFVYLVWVIFWSHDILLVSLIFHPINMISRWFY